jgi:hypothetical protein
MKTLKTLAFALAACLAISVSAQERGNMDPQQMAQKQTDNIKQHVTGVTSDQEAKILAIEQDFAKSAQDARTSANGDREAMRAKMQPLRQDRDAKIKAVLSDAQYTEYTQMEKEHQGGGKKGGQ